MKTYYDLWIIYLYLEIFDHLDLKKWVEKKKCLRIIGDTNKMKTVSEDEIFPIILIFMFPRFKLDTLYLENIFFECFYLWFIFINVLYKYPFLYEVINFLMAMANETWNFFVKSENNNKISATININAHF